MSKDILTFGDIEIEKNKFYRYKNSIFSKKDVDTEKVLVSNKISFGAKIIYTLLVTCIIIIKLSHYIQCFLKQAMLLCYKKSYDGQTKWMYFLIEDD